MTKTYFVIWIFPRGSSCLDPPYAIGVVKLSNGSEKLVEMQHVSKSFSGVQALHDVSFNLLPGEVHGLVGENGAGKSTLVKILAGIEKPDTATITIDGRAVTIRNAHHARELGVAAIFQELSQVPTLSVAENVFLSQEIVKSGLFLDRAAMVRKTQQIMDRYAIDLDPTATLCDLSVGQCQLAEILKAISIDARILIMDEPTASLTEGEARVVFQVIEDYKKTGAGIIYVSHRMDEVFTQTDRVTVLRDGRLVHCGRTEELDLQQTVRHMVGREVEIYQSTRKTPDAAAALKPSMEVRRLCSQGQFDDVSFELREGEILGIAGLVGSGRSELAEAIFGITRPDSGEIAIDGQTVSINSVHDALDHGIALVPEDRHRKGLVLDHTLAQNMILPVLDDFCRMKLIDYRRASRFVDENIGRLDIKPGDPRQIVNCLSGGNQQKVVIAKWLATRPKILIADEPTAGVDVHAKSEIHRLLRELTESGVSIILISSEMPELLAHSDRVMVMSQGRVLGIFDEIQQEQIMSLIMQDMMKSKQTLQEEVG